MSRKFTIVLSGDYVYVNEKYISWHTTVYKL